jgi:dethiobiotin synthetase
VLLVAHRGLGTINHTLLSLEALRNAGLEVAGVILNETRDVEPDFIRRDNPDAIAHFGRTRILGNVGFLRGLDANTDAAWTQFEADAPAFLAWAKEASWVS